VTARPRKYLLIAAAAVALLAVAAEGTALAKKNVIVATVNGKRYKWKGRYVVTGISGVGTITAAAKPARPGGVVRGIGFGCPVDLRNETLPLTPPAEYCTATYTEQTVSRTPIAKAWIALSNAQVTYQTFDGVRMTGTIAAVLDPLPGNASGPVTIEGTFVSKVSADQ
jgi:hypothetical protein